MKMDSVITIPAFGDNFIYLCQYSADKVFAIDPCDASAVLRCLDEYDLTLCQILVTHHHWDHTAGIAELKNKTGCKVIGSDKKIPGIDLVVKDGRILPFEDKNIQVFATPGHTQSSVCYYLQPDTENNKGYLWTGDTLFIAGCGRLLEGGADSMWHSLCRLTTLPDDTLVYPGHDYTLENYRFALSIIPEDQAIRQRIKNIMLLQKEGKPTVPSTISLEKRTNLFLRADTHELRAALNMPEAQAVEIFAELRRRKDRF